jgi:hypothetical protein
MECWVLALHTDDNALCTVYRPTNAVVRSLNFLWDTSVPVKQTNKQTNKRFQACPCGICGGLSTSGKGFVCVLCTFLVSIITPVLHTHLPITDAVWSHQLKESLNNTSTYAYRPFRSTGHTVCNNLFTKAYLYTARRTGHLTRFSASYTSFITASIWANDDIQMRSLLLWRPVGW